MPSVLVKIAPLLLLALAAFPFADSARQALFDAQCIRGSGKGGLPKTSVYYYGTFATKFTFEQYPCGQTATRSEFSKMAKLSAPCRGLSGWRCFQEEVLKPEGRGIFLALPPDLKATPAEWQQDNVQFRSTPMSVTPDEMILLIDAQSLNGGKTHPEHQRFVYSTRLGVLTALVGKVDSAVTYAYVLASPKGLFAEGE